MEVIEHGIDGNMRVEVVGPRGGAASALALITPQNRHGTHGDANADNLHQQRAQCRGACALTYGPVPADTCCI